MYATEPLFAAVDKSNPCTFAEIISNPLLIGVVGFTPSNPPWKAIVKVLYETSNAFAFELNGNAACESKPNTTLEPVVAPTGIGFK